MKKKLAVLFAVTFLLSSCKGEEIHKNISDPVITDIAFETTEIPPDTAETFFELADKPKQILSSESPTPSKTETSETELNSSEAPVSETASAEGNLPFSVYDSPA